MSWWWRQMRRYPLLVMGLTGCTLLVVWRYFIHGFGHGFGQGLTAGVGVLSGILIVLFLRQGWFAPSPDAPPPPADAELTRHAVTHYLGQLRQELTDLEQELGHPQPDWQTHWQKLNQALDVPLSLAWAGTLTPNPQESFPIDLDHPAWVLYGVNDRLTPAQITELTAYQTQTQPLQVVWCALPWQPADLILTVRAQLQALGYALPLITITPHPPAILVRKMQPQGRWEESWEIPSPVLDELTQWLTQRSQEPHWQYGAIKRRGQEFHALMQSRQQIYRAQQAQGVIHRYQVWAGVWAGLNPLPSLDLLASAAINAQMLVDLAQLYRRPLTLSQAQDMVSALGPMLLQMGAVEWVTTLAGAWLKSHLVTYGLGGAIQALSAAYLTHLAGHTFLETLQTPERELNPGLWQSLRTRGLASAAVGQFWQKFIPQSLPWVVSTRRPAAG